MWYGAPRMNPSRKPVAGFRATKPEGGPRPAGRAKRPRPSFEELIARIATRFIALPGDRVDGEILRAQQDVCERLGLDISWLWQRPSGRPDDRLSLQMYAPPDYGVPVLEMSARDFFPWSMAKLTKGETVILSRVADIPPEGARDLEIFRHYRIRSSIRFPLAVGGGPVFGAVSFETFRKPTAWTPAITGRLGLVAQVFASALFRKHAERELRENEAHYRALYEDSLEGIFRTSPEGTVLFANPAMARMLGYDSPAEVKRSITDLANQIWAVPEERARFIQRIREEGSIRAYECRLRRKDGTPIWMSINVRPVRDPDGRIVHFDGFVEDIDERRRAVEALRESESRYRGIFEGSLDGIYRVTPDGRLLTANSAMAKILGYDSAADLLASVTDVGAQVWESQDERARLLRELKGRGEVRGYECRFRRKDGSLTWVSLTFRVFYGPGGQIVYSDGFAKDINERKRTEREIAELRLELTHLSRILTVNEISSSLAHEINQPLGAILNNAEAAQILLSQPPARQRALPEIVDDIILDARRAGDVIRKVRRVVKRGETQVEQFSVNGLIDETLALVQNNLSLNNVTVRLDTTPDAADIRGDRVRLQQVLLNLITNALEAMREAPTRILTLRSAMDGPDRVVVSVGDSGPGVAESRRAMLFEPYYTTKKDGLGLGLAICRSIVEEHGGRIYVSDQAGPGATFSFSLKAWRDNEGLD